MQIGKKVKYDSYGRITLPAELADLLDLIKGEDEVTWGIVDGCVCLNKVTKTYAGGLDFESEEIEERLREYERKYYDDPNDDDFKDPEEIERRAREEYEKDKVARAALREARKNQ